MDGKADVLTEKFSVRRGKFRALDSQLSIFSQSGREGKGGRQSVRMVSGSQNFDGKIMFLPQANVTHFCKFTIALKGYR